jgi:hypothetical protein
VTGFCAAAGTDSKARATVLTNSLFMVPAPERC